MEFCRLLSQQIFSSRVSKWILKEWINIRRHFLFDERTCTMQSWAHRSYILSERSKAMSDLWFSERKKMSVERWANCQKKEFAHRSKRSLNLKERAFWVVRSLSDIVLGGQHKIKILETGKKFHKSKQPCPSRKIQVWAPMYPYTHRCIE